MHNQAGAESRPAGDIERAAQQVRPLAHAGQAEAAPGGGGLEPPPIVLNRYAQPVLGAQQVDRDGPGVGVPRRVVQSLLHDAEYAGLHPARQPIEISAGMPVTR